MAQLRKGSTIGGFPILHQGSPLVGASATITGTLNAAAAAISGLLTTNKVTTDEDVSAGTDGWGGMFIQRGMAPWEDVLQVWRGGTNAWTLRHDPGTGYAKFTTGLLVTNDLHVGEMSLRHKLGPAADVNLRSALVFRDNGTNADFIMWDDSTNTFHFYGDATIPGGETALAGNANLRANALTVGAITATSLASGVAKVGTSTSYTNMARFMHSSLAEAGQYALLQSDVGDTYLNAATGKSIYQRINNLDVLTVTSGGVAVSAGHLTVGTTTAGSNIVQNGQANWLDVLKVQRAGADVWQLQNDPSTGYAKFTSGLIVTNTAELSGGVTILGSRVFDTDRSLDVPTVKVNSKKLLVIPNTTTARTSFNPMFGAVRMGRQQFPDEEFVSGNNGVNVYSNGGTAPTITRIDMSTAPNASKKVLEIKHTGVSSPNFGGFVQSVNSAMSQSFVQVFRAKLPVGYTLNIAANSTGTGGIQYWLTDNVGTGKWEEYIIVNHSGDSGTFSSAAHVHVSGSPTPTVGAPLIWHLASCTVFSINDTSVFNATSLAVGGTTVIDSSRYVTTPRLYVGDTNTYLSKGSGSALRVDTPSGYTEYGAQNTSYAHFMTDRARFYFNKTVTAEGNFEGYHAGAIRWLLGTRLNGTNYSAYFNSRVDAPVFSVSSNPFDETSGSTWYGLGLSNLTSLSSAGTQAAVQLAGYFGLRMRSYAGLMDFYQTGKLEYTGGDTNTEFRLYSKGNVILTLDADTDNVNEADHPEIRLLQDAQGIAGRIRLADTFVGGTQAGNHFQIYFEDDDAAASNFLTIGTSGAPEAITIRASDGLTSLNKNVYVGGALNYGPNNHPILNGTDTWIRTRANEGIFFSSHSTGLYADNSSEVKVYNGKGFYAGAYVNTGGKIQESGAALIPAGTVIAYMGVAEPPGWLKCDGRAVSRTTYAALFAVVGTAYGAGNGSTTFNLPDMRGRTLAGLDNMGGTSASRVNRAEARTLTSGGVVGAEAVTLTAAQSGMPQHSHGVNDPGHGHYQWYSRGVDDNNHVNGFDDGRISQPDRNSSDYYAVSAAGAYTNIGIYDSGPWGASESHENMQPTMFVNYLIKT